MFTHNFLESQGFLLFLPGVPSLNSLRTMVSSSQVAFLNRFSGFELYTDKLFNLHYQLMGFIRIFSH